MVRTFHTSTVMNRFTLTNRVFSTAVVLVLTAVLVGLAVLQYRWSAEMSVANSDRMAFELEQSLLRLREDLHLEVAGMCLRLQVDPSASTRERRRIYVRQFESWRRTARHPGVVTNVVFLENDAKEGVQTLALDDQVKFHIQPWPARFAQLRKKLLAISSDLALAGSEFSDQQVPPPTGGDAKQAAFDVLSTYSVPILVDESIPAIALPVYHVATDSGRKNMRAKPEIDWLVVELDREIIEKHIVPELVAKFFGKPEKSEYQIAMFGGQEQKDLLYANDPAVVRYSESPADDTVRVFGPPPGPPLWALAMVVVLPKSRTMAAVDKVGEAEDLETKWPTRIEPIHYTPEQKDWEIIARHRNGSLDALVASTRRRTLITGFAVLILLGASMAMLLVSSRRAEALARQQMGFVAAVSHELRTPLAVICSAADNIADGVVPDKQRMVQYGTVIKSSTRQLIHLVEQVLSFAATRDERHRYDLAPIQVSEVVNDACTNTAWEIREAGVKLECDVAQQLPFIMGDRAALAHCLQNLITNAVKYGGPERWVRVTAKLGQSAKGSVEVQIAVKDRGVGISDKEIGHIFEPFYRSQAVISAQMRGTGLGLSLAITIARAMGGTITVSSPPGAGSTFVLHLPVIEHPTLNTGMQKLGTAPG